MSKFTTTLKGLMALALGSFALSASADKPTASPEPVGGGFQDATVWYYWDAPYRNYGYIANLDNYKTSTHFLVNNGVRPTEDGGLWCVVGDDTDGYSFYNKTDATKVFGLDTSNGQTGLYDAETPGANIATKFDFVDGTDESEGFYIVKVHGQNTILNPDGSNLSQWNTSNTSDAASTFRFCAASESPALPANFITEDENAPNYFLIRNMRGGDSATGGTLPYVNATGSGNLDQVSVDGTQALYNHAGAIWYFTKAGEPGPIEFGNGEKRYVVPVYIKNLVQPEKAFNDFSTNQFADNGSVYYIYEQTYHQSGSVYEGYSIIKKEADGFARPNQSHAWSDVGGNSQQIIGYGHPNQDGGTIFNFEKADSKKIELTLANYIQTTKAQFANVVKLYDMIVAGGDNTLANRIDNITSLAEINVINSEINEKVFSKLNRKVVYMIGYDREQAGVAKKYIYLDKASKTFKATDHKCVLGKWQLIQQGVGANDFVLRNIATDTYISVKATKINGSNQNNAGMASEESFGPSSQFAFRFVAQTDDAKNAFALQHTLAGNTPACLKIERADGNAIFWDGFSSAAAMPDKYLFRFEPANIANSDIEEYTEENNALYVIRSKRGKAQEDSYNDNVNVKYPGSLVTAYPADRELARERVKYRNGAHLEIYGPGSVWKFVKDTEHEGGWKIYSLIGEQTVSDNNKGLKVVGDYVEVAANPSTFYLNAVTDPNDFYSMPNVYALCTASEGGQYVTVSNDNEFGDYFLKLSATAPTTAADDAASFFIESIGKVHTESEPKGANPEKEYIDYAKELHMFKSIEPVLNDEDKEYILAEKKNASDEPYDYANIGSIAEANEFMGLGEMTASSRAFQRLDGKMIRLQNRMFPTYYVYSNTAAEAQYKNPMANTNALASQTLNSVWVVELPGNNDEEKTTSARMRQFRLRNLATGLYANADLQTGEEDEAQVFTVRRRVSLDGNNFYMALTKGYGRDEAVAMQYSATGAGLTLTPQASVNLRWDANSTQRAHWTVVNSVSTTAPTVTLTPADELDTYVLTVVKPEGVTAMSLTGLSGLADVTVEKFTNTRELTEPATVTLTTDADGNISGKISAQLASATVDNVYTVKLPAALLTMDNNVSPAVEAAVTVPQDPTLSGIREVNVTEKGADVIYDLQGRRVSKAGKGVYIINGVKTLVK